MSLIFIRGLEGVSIHSTASALRAGRAPRRGRTIRDLGHDPAFGQEFAEQHAQAGIAIVREQHARAGRQAFQQRCHRRHAGGEGQRFGAAFQRHQGFAQAVVGRVAFALVFVAGEAFPAGPWRKVVARWIGGATAPVAGSASLPTWTARVRGSNPPRKRSSADLREGAARGVDGRGDRGLVVRAGHEAGLERGRREELRRRSSIAWKKRLNAAVSQASACA